MHAMLAALLLIGCGPSTDIGDTDATDTEQSILQFESGEAPQNLLMISIDTLRRDQLDRYADPGHMPFLSSLATVGFALDNALGCSNWTLPATTCMVGGRSSAELAVETGVLPQTGDRALDAGVYPENTPFLAGWLRDAGFYSVLVSSNLMFGPEHGNGVGYDETEVRLRVSASDMLASGAERLDAAITEDRATDRWYLHVHLMDPHTPYAPPASYLTGLDELDPIPYDLTHPIEREQAESDILAGLLSPELAELVTEHLLVRYQGEVRWTDDSIRDFWEEFDASGKLDDTLVVIWTDHGEQFFDHGLLTHANLLHREENDILFFFWARDLVPGSSDLPVSATDLAPTLLDLYELERPAEVTGLRLENIREDRVRYALSVGKAGPIQLAERQGKRVHWAFADPASHDELIATQEAGLSFFDLDSDPEELSPEYDAEDPDVRALYGLAKEQIELVEPMIDSMGFETLWIPELGP